MVTKNKDHKSYGSVANKDQRRAYVKYQSSTLIHTCMDDIYIGGGTSD